MMALLLMLALQGSGSSPDPACQLECGMMASACIGECAGDLDPEKPENKSKIEACSKTCSAKAQPCMQACKKPAGKKP